MEVLPESHLNQMMHIKLLQEQDWEKSVVIIGLSPLQLIIHSPEPDKKIRLVNKFARVAFFCWIESLFDQDPPYFKPLSGTALTFIFENSLSSITSPYLPNQSKERTHMLMRVLQ